MKNLQIFLIASAVMLPAGVVRAQGTQGTPNTPGFYAGASIGYARNNTDCMGVADCNKSTTNWKGFAGYQINEMLGVEAQYFDFGTANAGANIAPVGNTKIDVKSTGFGIRGVASFPGNQTTSPYVAIGVNRVKSDPQTSVPGATGFSSNTATKPEFALGVDYKVNPNLKVRGEFDAVRFAGAPGVNSYTNSSVSVGLRYQF